jgi:hypothetical protein
LNEEHLALVGCSAARVTRLRADRTLAMAIRVAAFAMKAIIRVRSPQQVLEEL